MNEDSYAATLMSEQQEFLCIGSHANLRSLSAAERAWFPGADVVREVRTTDAHWTMRNFYRYKLLGLLFPRMFPTVRGANQTALPKDLSLLTNGGETDPFRSTPAMIPQYYTSRLFSVLAPVPQDHLVYTTHMRREPEGKFSVCGCDVCRRHRMFHAEHELQRRSYELHGQLEQTGVQLEWHDSTDYCLSDDGLFFFETENIHYGVVGEYVANAEMPEEHRMAVRQVLSNIRRLRNASRNDMLTSESSPECILR